MTALAIVVLALCTLVLMTVVLNMTLWPGLRPFAGGEPGTLSVLIPARNEAERLGPCLESVLRQGAVTAEVLVYDDHSTDGTAELVRQFGERDPRVRVLPGKALPEGWCGKPFACAQLAEQAVSDWLLFLDADTVLGGDAVARMSNEAAARDATFLSCWPGLDCHTFWERVLMPMLGFSVFTLFPAPLSLSRNDPSMGLAHGACILAHREVYAAVGGHAAVRHELFEDTCLARLWRARGHRGLCLDGQDVVRVRMYEDLGESWQGFLKNFYPAFRRTRSFALFMLFHFACFLLPFLMIPVALLTGGAWPVWAAAAGMVLAMRAVMGVRFGHPWWSSLCHPVAEAMLLGLGVSSWRRCRSGRGVEWKGRRYHTGASGEKR